jgi:hypothetical protein
MKIIDKNVLRQLKYVVKITDLTFSRKVSRKFPLFLSIILENFS